MRMKTKQKMSNKELVDWYFSEEEKLTLEYENKKKELYKEFLRKNSIGRPWTTKKIKLKSPNKLRGEIR